VLVDARDLAFQVDLLASVHLGVVDDGMWEVVTWDRDAYAVLCYPAMAVIATWSPMPIPRAMPSILVRAASSSRGSNMRPPS
ncbi:hypothetical protein, partial [Mesorhizobium sp. M0571]|uniref:hypothetical protein n=1 Tax=Mesorhizobium sp. M0571 TaxID=2956960 RepID=UPI00333A4303